MEPTGRTRTSQNRLCAPQFDSLGAIRARPALIERAVRTALTDAMKWRLGGGGAPAENSFAFAAAAAARQEVTFACGSTAQRPDVASISRAAATAAVRFFRAPLGKRLLNLPSARIAATGGASGAADVALRDGSGRLHLIALTTLHRPLDISARAHDVVRKTTIAPRDYLSGVRIHMYSLVTEIRYESSACSDSRGVHSSEAARIA